MISLPEKSPDVFPCTLRGATQAPARLIRALLIEDSPDDAWFISQSLNESDNCRFEVSRASTLREGLDRMSCDEFSVILLDLNLPDSSGVNTYRDVATIARDIPIVVFTSIGGDALAVQLVSEGAQDFVFKNHIEPYWLVRSILNAIDRG